MSSPDRKWILPVVSCIYLYLPVVVTCRIRIPVPVPGWYQYLICTVHGSSDDDESSSGCLHSQYLHRATSTGTGLTPPPAASSCHSSTTTTIIPVVIAHRIRRYIAIITVRHAHIIDMY